MANNGRQKGDKGKENSTPGSGGGPRRRRFGKPPHPPRTAVVALGGSAGSLTAFKTFFEAMPADSGAAFVVIQHLAPDHDSLLPELLGRHTAMRVTQARNGTPVEPDCVYVIPPGEYLGIRGGTLYFDGAPPDGIRMPIDFFLRNLAEDCQERAVCVLFSGAGSDGSLGVRAVRGAGGLTIAQDPRTAQYGDMPRSAIATKLVDLVLAPDGMPQAIMEYLRQPYVRGGAPMPLPEAEDRPGHFDEILATVESHTGSDFRCYKQSTILRRIERRMGLRRIVDMSRYSSLLRRDPTEVGQLYKDLLINVTSFFRDSEAFEDLHRQAITPLVRARSQEDPLRVWIVGCSSGEEAYSVVMLLREEMESYGRVCPVQIFATDLDEEALEFARQGVYPESIASDVNPQRLTKFFHKKDLGYQVSETLRNCVVFAAHNLITDPPFSRMDLITCRNLLIYLDSDTQSRLIPLFNFALNSGGYLFLGKSEGISGQSDLFSLVSKKAGLYRRITPSKPIALDTPISAGRKKAAPAGPETIKPPATYYANAIRQAILNHFAASVVLIDRKGQILQFHGQTGKYLHLPSGEPVLNLLEIAKEGLALRLRAALHTALEEDRPVGLDPVALTLDQDAPSARVTITPLPRRLFPRSPQETEPLIAVIFEDVPRPLAPVPEPLVSDGNELTIRRLEDELRSTQQDLRSTIEELQAANEELRVSNEEVLSTNEELQSTNEELQTSKEELQSVNEELTTLNTQLQEKIERLDAANRDIANLLKASRIATMFLDETLRIKLFTPAVTRVLSLIPSDLGRPISDLSTNFVNYDLTADTRTVAKNGTVLERDVRHANGSAYLVRIMPYLGPEDHPDGVVVTFDDLTRLRRAEEQTRLLATVMADFHDAMILFDCAGAIQAWNRGAQEMYGWTEEEARRMNIRDLTAAGKAAAFDEMLRALTDGEFVPPVEIKRQTKDGRELDVWLTLTAVREDSGDTAVFASTERDITARNLAQDEILKHLREVGLRNEELEKLNRAMVDRELRMVELKKQINELSEKAGRSKPYDLDFRDK